MKGALVHLIYCSIPKEWRPTVWRPTVKMGRLGKERYGKV